MGGTHFRALRARGAQISNFFFRILNLTPNAIQRGIARPRASARCQTVPWPYDYYYIDFSEIITRNVNSVIHYRWKSHWWDRFKRHQLIFSDCHEKIFLKSDFLFVFCHWYYWKLQKSSFCHWSHTKIQKSTFCHGFFPKFDFTPDLNQIQPRVNIHPGCRTMSYNNARIT